MSQSSTRERALLGKELFWERPTVEPPLRWDCWRLFLKLAILAKEGISVNTLREQPPDTVLGPLNSSTKQMWTIVLLKMK